MASNATASSSKPDKVTATNKKVSRACNTCRVKRTKCDGRDPCSFCVDNRAECSYTGESRRRGPPSGYLRYIETRVSILETFLGLVIARSTPSTVPAFVEFANVLKSQSKTATQDVWDAQKDAWNTLDAAKLLEEVILSFAPFAHRDQETLSKPLLPQKSSATPANQPANKRSVPPEPTPRSALSFIPQGPPTPPVSLLFQPQSSFAISTESFERTQIQGPPSPPIDLPRSDHLAASRNKAEEHRSWSSAQEDPHYIDNFSFPEGTDTPLRSIPSTSSPSRYENMLLTDAAEARNPSPEKPMSLLSNQASSMLPRDPVGSNSNYTGSYWRTVEALEEVSPSASNALSLPAADDGELPPQHIVSYLLDVYYLHVHPVFPFLSSRSELDGLLIAPTEGGTGLLLALCSYTGRLSPSLGNPSIAVSFGVAGDAGKIAADLWYEQARKVLNKSLRLKSKIETVQALLLLALRDQGKGNESQAWLLLGMAVRMGQDLELHSHGSSQARYTSEELQNRRRIWGVVSILDLYLSLQLGRPSAIVDGYCDFSNTPGTTSPISQLVSPDSSIPGSSFDTLFGQTVSLCRIISRINFYLYLNLGSKSLSDMLVLLKSELDIWHQGLPVQFRISIGHQPTQDVLEVNMLYHIAVILLYRPFSKNRTLQAAEIFLDAASTFNVLLAKYRSSKSFSLSNPHLIYLIFTAAVAHLSGFRQLENVSTAMSLQTQLHLLNCYEALKSISATWELAGRCSKTLDKFMDAEGMKPPTSSRNAGMSLGKRKREVGDPASSGPRGEEQYVPSMQMQHTNPPPLPLLDQAAMFDTSSLATNTFTSPSQMLQMSSNWPGSSIPPPPPSGATDTSVFFDPEFFSSSTGWLPEINSVDSMPAMWNSGWDEDLMSRIFGPDAVNGVSANGAVILSSTFPL